MYDVNELTKNESKIQNSLDLNEYLKSGEGKSNFYFKDKKNVFAIYELETPANSCRDGLIGLLIKNKIKFFESFQDNMSGREGFYSAEASVIYSFCEEDTERLLFSAFIVSNTSKKQKSSKHLMLINGDYSLPDGGTVTELSSFRNNMFDYLERYDQLNSNPVISFNCLARLIGPKTRLTAKEISSILEKLNPLDLHILDFEEAQHVTLSVADQKKVKENKYIPPVGFTLMLHKQGIHRSGAVLLEHKSNYYLLGQDEGTYFGVQLPKKATTLDQAYSALVPKEVLGKKYQRQGEWFVVSVKDAGLKVPATKDCVTYRNTEFWEDFSVVVLPREENGNPHEIRLEKQDSDYRVDSSNRIYAKKFNLVHNDHSDLDYSSNEEWQTFFENTALKSVSQEGVD